MKLKYYKIRNILSRTGSVTLTFAKSNYASDRKISVEFCWNAFRTIFPFRYPFFFGLFVELEVPRLWGMPFIFYSQRKQCNAFSKSTFVPVTKMCYLNLTSYTDTLYQNIILNINYSINFQRATVFWSHVFTSKKKM